MQLNPNAPEFMPLRRVNAPEYALNNGNNFARISNNIKNSLNEYTTNTITNRIAVGSNKNAMANNWSDPVTNNNYKKLLNKTMNKAMANNLFGSNGNMGAIRRGQRGLAKSLAKNKGKRKNRKATRKNRK